MNFWTSADFQKFFCPLLVCLLFSREAFPHPRFDPQAPVREQIATMEKLRRVEVRLHNGDKLKGLLGDVSESSFKLYAERAKPGPERLDIRAISFDAVASVRPLREGHTLRNGIIIGAVAVVAVGIVVGLLYLSAFEKLGRSN